MRNIGSSIGISLVIFLLTRNTQIVHSELVAHVTPFNDALGELGPVQFWNRATTVGLAALDAEVTKQASIVAYADDFKLMMLVALVAFADLPAEARQGAPWRDGGPRLGLRRR